MSHLVDLPCGSAAKIRSWTERGDLTSLPGARVARTWVLGLLALLALTILGPAQAQITNPQAWSNVYNAAAFPSGSVGAYPVSAGSNRLLVVAVSTTRSGVGAQTISASYGGVAMSKEISDETNTAARQHTALFYLTEAGLSSAVGNALSVTVTGGTANWNQVFAGVYAGIDQVTPITNSSNYSSNDTTVDPTGPLSPALVIASGDRAVEVALLERNNNSTPRTIDAFAANWTSVINTATGTPTNAVNTYIIENPVATGGTTSVHGISGNNTRVSMSAMTLKRRPIPPTITSPAGIGFVLGLANSFTVTATGDPTITYSVTGALPTGVTFTAGGVLSGTPGAGTAGTYPLVITASNSGLPNATQNFTLTVLATTPGPGQDGNVTLTGSFVLNSYSTLNGAAAAGATSFTVASAAALALPACGAGCANSGPLTGNGLGTALAARDLLMIYQPQELGGTITTTDSTAFGAVTDYGQAGQYEFVYVASVAGNVVTIDTSAGANCTGLKKSYDSGAMIVRVPQLRNLVINSGGVLTAPAWNGSTGGVVALDVRPGAPYLLENGNIAINGTGSISVTGLGFRPGQIDNQTTAPAVSAATTTDTYRASLCTAGGRKGESILGWAGDINTTADATCGTTNNATGSYIVANSGPFNRGALANGGGGGNAHNAGGGGGANGGSLAAWNGGGNPDRGAANVWDPAWARDDNTADANDLPTVTATSTSSGGGRGGYSFAFSNLDALAVPPGCNIFDGGCGGGDWTGDRRVNRGGLGARPLNRRPVVADTVDRFYFGGGGGAGDGNNSASANGGPGGGLIFLITQRILTDAGAPTTLIEANGGVGQNTVPNHNDAPGGGGAGGTIVALVAQGIVNNVRFAANGGAGGNQLITNNESEGPGGGGSGGVIALNFGSGAPATQVLGAANGTTTSAAVTEFIPNGATRGGAGEVITAPAKNSTPLLCLQDGGSFTTPVTNAWFQSRRNGGKIDIDFASSAEVGNLGYQIYGERNGSRQRIGAMIASPVVDSTLPQRYSASIDDPGYDALYLADISIAGKEALRGPFLIGNSYGEPPVADLYDWSEASAELAQFAGSRRSIGGTQRAQVRSTRRGMQVVSHEALLVAGIDLAGVSASDLAVVGREGPVVRRVRGGASFGPGSTIEFYSSPQPGLYAANESYLIGVDRAQVLDMRLANPLLLPAGPIARQWARVEYAPQTGYSFSSPLADPWYAARVVANGGPGALDIPINAEAANASGGQLKLVLWGGLNYAPGALPDHHVRVLFNGVLVADQRFDGIVASEIDVPLDNVQSGANSVRIELPRDTGNAADLVYLESIELRYQRTPAFAEGRLFGDGMRATGTASDLLFADGIGDAPSITAPLTFDVITLPGMGASSRNFRIDAGIPTELALALGKAIPAEALGESSEIWMSEPQGLFVPSVSAVPANSGFPDVAADYWVISHGLFATALEPLIARRQAQGLRTAVVDVEQIYQTYSAGNVDPEAIKRFVREWAAPSGARYLLLVGGDTTDAAGYLNSGSISFVPTIYARTNEIVAYAPADPIYGDLTGDGVPEIAVGRLPVRTVAEADEAVRKILAFETQPAGSRVMTVAGAADTSQSLNFAGASAAFRSTLPIGWQQSSIDVDTLGVASARAAVIDGFNAGQSLVAYTGHSSPTQWGFEQVLGSAQIPSLQATSNAPVVLQFGCWTTYFVSPAANSMSQALMLTPQRGASAVFGSTVLLDQPSHEQMAAALGPRLQPGTRIGDAILAAKRQVAEQSQDQMRGLEVYIGISLLGDPAQQIR